MSSLTSFLFLKTKICIFWNDSLSFFVACPFDNTGLEIINYKNPLISQQEYFCVITTNKQFSSQWSPTMFQLAQLFAAVILLHLRSAVKIVIILNYVRRESLIGNNTVRLVSQVTS